MPTLLFHSVLAALALIGGFSAAARAQGCAGCTPLTDLGTGLYLGQYQGGLYPGGANEPPPAHRAAALAAANRVVPRDAAGTPDESGLIGFLSLTMSNVNQEFSAFERRADLDRLRGARVAIVNGAQGGQTLDRIVDPNLEYWSNLDQRIDAAGLSAEQVQVVWFKVVIDTTDTFDFPDRSIEEQARATEVLQLLKQRFPNLELAFLSSRIYSGDSILPQRDEPLSYHTGFSTKWLIEAQINGDPNLNHDPSQGPVVSPVILWGPYMWANGTIPRADGLTWEPTDFEGDGIHPTPAGEQKVADMLEAFFHSNPVATRWYARPRSARRVTLDAVADATVDTNAPAQNFGAAPLLLATGDVRRAYLKFHLSGVVGSIERAKLSLIVPPVSGTSEAGTELRGVGDTSWQEGAITALNAPPVDGARFGTLPYVSRGTAISFDVTDAVLAAGSGEVSFALVTDSAISPTKRFLSREAGDGPRLELTVVPPCDEPAIPYCPATINSSGAAASLDFAGSASVTTNDARLVADGLPAGQFALFYYGFAPADAPFGGGVRCIAAPFERLNPAAAADAAGHLERALDFTAPPLGAGAMAVAPGDALHVQCWFRDPRVGPSGFGLGQAVRVDLCP